jgi:hypothetical protein
MVIVNPTPGRLGNQMFSYCFARIIAQEFNYALINNLPLLQELNLTSIDGNICRDPQEIIYGYDYKDDLLENILKNKKDRMFILEGYFQKYIYYKNYKQEIRTWFKELNPNKEQIEENTIGIHIRKDDIPREVQKCDLPDEYFIDILKTEKPEKIIITSDEPTHSTIKKIQNEFKNVEIYNGSTIDTLKKFVCFKKLILSFGTYSWWMGFLSNASKIYMKDKIDNDIDLVIRDDKNYIIV